MLFNSLIFLFVFLPATYLVFWKLQTKDARYIWLTVTGYIFYGWWNYPILLSYAFFDASRVLSALAISRAQTSRFKKLFLLSSVVVDLSLLGFFKYFNFVSENLNALLIAIHGDALIPHLNIILPVGISFYTFHTLSYVIDTYRDDIRPTRNFFEFSCYVSLFSQLVAGPIVRFRQIEADLENIDHGLKYSSLERGISYLILGLAKKVLIADTLAAFVNPGFENISNLSTLNAWVLILGYTYQLYFDFSGYSDMAIGLGDLFGIRIPINFNSPYKATNPSDFWRRWHISLSSWLRDYLYIGLGGNRRGEARTLMNLMLTMLLGGLWHGAQWTFVIWGFYHGFLLILHRLLQTAGLPRLTPFIARTLMFISVVIGWVFFRSSTLSASREFLGKMFGTHSIGVSAVNPAFLSFVAFAAVVSHFLPNTHQFTHRYSWKPALLVSALFGLCLLRILSDGNSPFLYFQF